MPQRPDRRAPVRGFLVDVGKAAERALDRGGIERLVGRETVEAAATHRHDLVDQHVARRAQLALVARLAQDPPEE